MFNLNLIVPTKYLLQLVDKNLPLLSFYKKSELLWLDSFLFDFLQKKTIDLWIRRFVVFSGFLFSETYVYTFIIRIYSLGLVIPISSKLPFENFNPIENILSIFFFFSLIILFVFIAFLFFLL